MQSCVNGLRHEVFPIESRISLEIRRVRPVLLARGNVFLRGDISPTRTVFDDGEVDVISGNQASDWFFANLAGGVLDILDDRTSSENQNDIN